MLALNGLPRFYHPVFQHRRFERATDDRYLLVVEASDPKFDIERTPRLLAESGRLADGGGREMKRVLLHRRHWLVLARLRWIGPRKNAPVVIFTDMDYQGRYEPQGDRKFNGEQPIFCDHRASRRPVEGTVAVGIAGGRRLVFDAAVVSNNVCRPEPADGGCGPAADLGSGGSTPIALPATTAPVKAVESWASAPMWIPTNLQEPRVKDMNDGEIFNVITNGRRSMPPYKFQVSDRDRWAMVAYVRALQRTIDSDCCGVPEDTAGGVEVNER